MALVACKECKKEVASSAKKCPHCGVANPSMGVKETLTGLVVLGVAVAVAMTMCSDKKSEPAGMAMPSVAAQVPPAESTTEATVSGMDAKSYIANLDTALRDGDRLMRDGGDLKSVSGHSRRMNELAQAGQRFGETVMDMPLGFCFGAGVQARAAWQAMVQTATTSSPGTVDESARKQFLSYRGACLEAAASSQ